MATYQNHTADKKRLITAILSNNNAELKTFLDQSIAKQPVKVNSATIEAAFNYLVKYGPVNARWECEPRLQHEHFEAIHGGFLIYNKIGKDARQSVPLAVRKQMIQVLDFVKHFYKEHILGL